MNLVKHLKRQREFSLKTFGPGYRVQRTIAHIKKELEEIEESPYDLEEWIDLILLAMDGAWRSGATPAEIAEMLDYKQSKNESRAWPDWRTVGYDTPIEHIKENDNESIDYLKILVDTTTESDDEFQEAVSQFADNIRRDMDDRILKELLEKVEKQEQEKGENEGEIYRKGNNIN